ncbi:Arginine biosynthesis protein ArgJ [Syntrophomonas zehnderi OL-4]|uniref:Arginine biosynthesis bifunctional protein ArgJ n=1 Tax=Syntrophomonas zehnderi OL-4 TaxID=690567 RepID=A0A0E3W2K6_9FIRM|nr:bifunctional glutamate N-acetyltransferase/amino-acid acetyltransferase ArgJ [Syntrophomonas zehnderi]CFX05898.1 Arginine biosynthesis protein ArgJ [Syntrophomonas zehnderi OL-4]CFX34146.1 Arginine biosynthesis protein ArgJ [Syntrophomonas zehnderi OL-4]
MIVLEGSVTSPQGFLAQGVAAEIKKNDKKDLAIIYSTTPCTAAGVFTTNIVRAACVDLNRNYLKDGKAQAIVVNSGNANACTGEQGWEDTVAMAATAADCLELHPHDTLVASTGVIGVYLPMEQVKQGIVAAAGTLSEQGGANAAAAILTTDLIPKEVAVEVDIAGYPVRIGAIAKGSGMIHPNMATMLCFITTDVGITNKCLDHMLRSSVGRSFNMISVDGDTSTNDMALILANGQAGNPLLDDPDSEAGQAFQKALDYVTITLAKMIARDGEGANHLIEVQVEKAPDEITAQTIARAITASNLIKAAVFGEDANWGRILAAAGYCGAQFDPGRVDIYLGEEMVAQDGMGLVFDEDLARQELQKDTVIIRLDLKSGSYSATAWGCDLSYEYVRINAAYRT